MQILSKDRPSYDAYLSQRPSSFQSSRSPPHQDPFESRYGSRSDPRHHQRMYDDLYRRASATGGKTDWQRWEQMHR